MGRGLLVHKTTHHPSRYPPNSLSTSPLSCLTGCSHIATHLLWNWLAQGLLASQLHSSELAVGVVRRPMPAVRRSGAAKRRDLWRLNMALGMTSLRFSIHISTLTLIKLKHAILLYIYTKPLKGQCRCVSTYCLPIPVIGKLPRGQLFPRIPKPPKDRWGLLFKSTQP